MDAPSHAVAYLVDFPSRWKSFILYFFARENKSHFNLFFRTSCLVVTRCSLNKQHVSVQLIFNFCRFEDFACIDVGNLEDSETTCLVYALYKLNKKQTAAVGTPAEFKNTTQTVTFLAILSRRVFKHYRMSKTPFDELVPKCYIPL